MKATIKPLTRRAAWKALAEHRVRHMVEQANRACDLEVDGGSDEQTAPLAVKAGANVLVAGAVVFELQAAANSAVTKQKNRRRGL